MADNQLQSCALSKPAFLWVDCTGEPSLSAAQTLVGAFRFERLRDPHRVSSAIGLLAPPFVCFEFDDCSEAEKHNIELLARVRCDHPNLPVLVIAGCNSISVAIWAVRLHVSELILKPISLQVLCHAIDALASRHDTVNAPWLTGSGSMANERRTGREVSIVSMRVSAAIHYVAQHYGGKISLDDAAAACRLSRSQFCRTFKQEYRLTFGQYLLRYRLERAREQLASPGALVKEVAYAVGFNDHAYFTRSFRREFGSCPSAFQRLAAPQAHWHVKV